MSIDLIPQRLSDAGITFLERGWLSANNILIQGNGPTALVDSGYWTHAGQTLALVKDALHDQTLDLLLNTHLHSDHCGGNAALQKAYPDMRTLIAPGQAAAVEHWDPVALTYEPTGQDCPRFRHDGLLQPGDSIRLGGDEWEIHGARGHDPHSVVLFHPRHRILISADALWENGFGVVFPELEGIEAFDEVDQTLNVIEKLAPALVLPGHGRGFTDVSQALGRARTRLDQFINNPAKHHRHALKVLIKYKLLEWQRIEWSEMLSWAKTTTYIARSMPSQGSNDADAAEWLNLLLQELSQAKALTVEGSWVVNT